MGDGIGDGLWDLPAAPTDTVDDLPHSKLSLDTYQRQASTTALYPGQGGFIGLVYATLGLNGEAGETGEQIKKIWRDDAADIEKRVHAILETVIAWGSNTSSPRPNARVVARDAHDQIREAFRPPINEERREKIAKELGDALWYAAQVATELDMSLGEVAQQNIDKLAARRAANKIHGEGSDR